MKIDVFLPTLVSIELKNYTLYEQKPSFSYKFVNGVNLIIGGNGVGKTTFVNLIRYCLIGGYFESERTRVYNYNQIIKRRQFPKYYFRDRMKQKDTESEVKLVFTINNVTFEVTRNLYNLELSSVKVLEDKKVFYLEGEKIKQYLYDNLTKEEKEEYLQYIYECKISEVTNLTFDNFIFFVNEVMMFDEDRKTILWDIDKQDQLANKYFNSHELNKEYDDIKGKSKYYDSLARHKQEEIKAITRVLNKINDEKSKSSVNTREKNIKEIENIKKKIEATKNRLQSTYENSVEIESILKRKVTERTELNRMIIDIEKKIRNSELDIYKVMWETLHPLYDDFLQNIKFNNLCPLCNKPLEEHLLGKLLEDDDKCIFCRTELKSKVVEPVEVTNVKKELKKLLIDRNNLEKDIVSYQKEIEKLDRLKEEHEAKIFEYQSRLRELEYTLNLNDSDNSDNFSYKVMLKQISDLEKDKNNFKNTSIELVKRSREITETIELERKIANNDLSQTFSTFAEKFIGYPSYLSYTALGGEVNRNVPVINGKPRLSKEELSESQRFFIDQSFRMSILNFFYRNPTFFICETPDSSLDISYEANAANIYLQYLTKANSLIITSNLNNSEFLDRIIENSNEIDYINLLEYGGVSDIQGESKKLREISKRIGEKIDEKSKSRTC